MSETDSEIFDEGQESESTSSAQAAANREAIASRADRTVEHLEATLGHVAVDEVEGVKAKIASIRNGDTVAADETPEEDE